MKAYKGFNKDMTCRGFQFEEGQTYREDKAEMCVSGFHACENPLDCFGYYTPCSSVYHEVELEEVAGEKDHSLDFDDTKRCGKVIKIGAALDVAGICKAHFEYTKSRCTPSDSRLAGDRESAAAGECGSAAAGNRGSAAAGECGSAAAGNRGSAAAGKCGSAAAGECGSAAAGNRGSAAAGKCGSAAAGECGSAAAGNRGSAAAGDWGSAAAGECGSAAAGNRGSAAAGECGSAAAGNRGSAAAGDWGSAAAGECGSAAAGECGSAAARGTSSVGEQGIASVRGDEPKAKGGLGAVLVIAKEKSDSYDVADWCAGVVDGEKIKADTWYTVKDGAFVEVKE